MSLLDRNYCRWDVKNPAFTAAKWNFIDFQSPSYSAIMMEYTTPPSYGSTVVNVGGIAEDGKIICAGSANSAEHTSVTEDPSNEWPEPSSVKYLWSGKTKEGESVTAELVGSLGKRLDKVDIMAKVPNFVKSIVGGVAGTKPFIYQVCHLWLQLCNHVADNASSTLRNDGLR